MRTLFDYGYERGRRGYDWARQPPNYQGEPPSPARIALPAQIAVASNESAYPAVNRRKAFFLP